MIELGLLRRGYGISRKKITAYPNEAIHDDCVVAFTGAYEKIASETQTRRVDVDRWYST